MSICLYFSEPVAEKRPGPAVRVLFPLKMRTLFLGTIKATVETIVKLVSADEYA